MSTQTIRTMEDEQTIAEEMAAQRHLALYGWIYMVMGGLTALALYAMFSFPQGEI